MQLDPMHIKNPTLFQANFIKIIEAINSSPTRSLPNDITPRHFLDAIDDQSKTIKLVSKTVSFRHFNQLKQDAKHMSQHYSRIKPFAVGQPVYVRLSRLRRNANPYNAPKTGSPIWSKDIYVIDKIFLTTPLPSYMIVKLNTGTHLPNSFSHGDLKGQ